MLVERRLPLPAYDHGAEGEPLLQPARRARCDLGHRARRVHRPRAEPRPRCREALPRAAAGRRSMPRLLLEIGCEELPAAACMEAGLQLPELVREHARRASARALRSARAGSRSLATCRSGPRTSGSRARRRTSARRRRPASRRSTASSVDDLTLRDGFLGVEVPGRPIADVLPERLAAIVTGLQFAQVDGLGRGLPRSRARCAGCARSSKTGRSMLRSSTLRAAASPTGIAHRIRGRSRSRTPTATSPALRAAGVEPDRAVRYERIVAGLDALGAVERPARQARRGRLPRRAARSCWRARSTSASCGCPSACRDTTMQSHQRYFPLGGNRFAFVANGGDPDVVRAGNEFVLARPARGRRVHVRARRRGRDRRAGGAARRRSRSSRARARTPTRPHGSSTRCAQLGGDEHAVEAARLAKADQASELVREFPELEGTSARRTHSSPAAGRRRRARSTSSTCRTRPARRFRRRRPGACSQPPTSSITSSTASISVTQPTGSRDPYRASSRGDRPEPARARGRASQCSASSSAPRRTSSRSGSRDCSTCRSSSFAPRARPPRPTSAASRGLRSRCTPRSARRSSKRCTPPTTARIASPARPSRKPHASSTTRCSRTGAERDLANALHGAQIDELAAAAQLAPHVNRYFDEVLVMSDDPNVRANRLRLLLDVRDALGRLGDFSLIPR